MALEICLHSKNANAGSFVFKRGLVYKKTRAHSHLNIYHLSTNKHFIKK